jgi:hypothetical protein
MGFGKNIRSSQGLDQQLKRIHDQWNNRYFSLLNNKRANHSQKSDTVAFNKIAPAILWREEKCWKKLL